MCSKIILIVCYGKRLTSQKYMSPFSDPMWLLQGFCEFPNFQLSPNSHSVFYNSTSGTHSFSFHFLGSILLNLIFLFFCSRLVGQGCSKICWIVSLGKFVTYQKRIGLRFWNSCCSYKLYIGSKRCFHPPFIIPSSKPLLRT